MILGIDPGSVSSSYARIDFGGNPIERGTMANEELAKALRDSVIDPDAACIECPTSRAGIERQAIFDTIFWVGRFYECLLEYQLMEKVVTRSRGEVMKLLGLPQRTNDRELKAYLESIYGGDKTIWNDKRVSKSGKPLPPKEEKVYGLLHGWNVHERDALAVALAELKVVKG